MNSIPNIQPIPALSFGAYNEACDVLLWFDGPLIVLHSTQDGELLLALLVDTDMETDVDRWLICLVTPETVAKLKQKEMPLREAILRTPGGVVYLQDVDQSDARTHYQLALAQIPEDYLPDPDAFLI